MQHISSFNRLWLCLKEFWELNYKTILAIPLATLIFFLLFLLWPGKYVYNLIFNSEMAQSTGYFMGAMESGFGRERVMLLCLVPIFLFLVSNKYLRNLKTTSSYTTKPFSNTDRILCLWIYTLLVIGLSIFSIYIYDIATVAIFKNMYYDKTLALLEQHGNLYPKFEFGSFFISLEPNIYLGISIFTFLLLPFYHLAYFLFRKNSLLWSVLLYILIVVAAVYTYVKLIANDHILISFHPVVTMGIYTVMILFVLMLFVAAFKEKLKEREV